MANFKEHTKQAANEALGKRKKRRHKRRLIYGMRKLKTYLKTRRRLIYGI